MEALTSATVAGLTLYDMCKGIDKGMVMQGVRVLSKSGGKSGDWRWDDKDERVVKMGGAEKRENGKAAAAAGPHGKKDAERLREQRFTQRKQEIRERVRSRGEEVELGLRGRVDEERFQREWNRRKEVWDRENDASLVV